MKKTTIAAIAAILIMLASSCKKEKTPGNQEVKYETYSALKPGNYWIYQRYTIDSNGVATATNKFDSCYVEKDTLIRGEIYFKVIRPEVFNFFNTNIYYMRDSLHYLINDQGRILFSSQDKRELTPECHFLDGDTLFYISETPGMEERSVTVPAGTFMALTFTKELMLSPSFFGHFLKRKYYTSYAKNIGILVEPLTNYAFERVTHERRLLRYHVE